MRSAFKLAALALLVVSCTASRTLKQDEEAGPPGAALARLAWVAASLPSCRLDPKFFTIDLEKCDSLSDLADRIAKNQTVDKITCEPECATEWKKLNGVCAKDVFNTFSAEATGFMNATLMYWGACAAQNIASELGYPPEATSILPPEKVDEFNAVVYGPARIKSHAAAPAPESALAEAEQKVEMAQAALVAAQAAIATAAAGVSSLETVKAANGP